MNKTLKTIVAAALISMPVSGYAGTAPVAQGNGGNDGRNAVIGLAILTFLAVILGSDGGSIGMGNGSSAGGDGTAASNNGSAGSAGN